MIHDGIPAASDRENNPAKVQNVPQLVIAVIKFDGSLNKVYK